MSQEEQLISFFLYSIFIYPVSNYLVSPKRPYARWKGAVYAMLFLFFISGMHMMYENREKGPNYYSILECRRNDLTCMKKNFKKLSLELHPDKNKSPEAVDQFRRVKQAYETLSKSDRSRIYNLFGEDGIKRSEHSVIDTKQTVVTMIVYYMSTAMFVVIMTASEPSGDAMSLSMFGLLGVLLFECILILEEVKLPFWLFPYLSSFDLVTVAKRMFPAFMNGCRCISSSYHVDRKEKLAAELSLAVSAVKQTSLKVNELVQSFLDNYKKRNAQKDDNDLDEGIVAGAVAQIKQKGVRLDGEGQMAVKLSVALINDPKKLRYHEKQNNVYEFFRNIIIYLIVWHVARNILKMGTTSN